MTARHLRLKAKRLKFIQEYLIDFDGQAAAIRAGYSEHSARFLASRLLANKDVKAELEQRIKENKEKNTIRREFIVEKLMKLIAECDNDKDRKTLIKSLDMLNKMSGQYTHTVVNVNPEQPLFPDVK
jgi:phage terminase small subunit